MRRVAAKLIGLLKGEEFIIDQNISSLHIVILVATKTLHLCYGILRFSKVGPFFVDPRSNITSSKQIEFKGLINISKHCEINALSIRGIRFGKNVSLHPYVSIEGSGSISSLGIGIDIGNNVGIGKFSHLGGAGGISIADNCIIGQYVSFHSENHNFFENDKPFRNQGVKRIGIEIGENCWIGTKATILDGVKLGENSIIAAGAVLTSGIYKGNTLYAGIPAKPLREIL